MALRGSLSLAPYLHVVPADLVCFQELFRALGVRDAFGARDYVHLLRTLHEDSAVGGREEGGGGEAEARDGAGQPLTPQQLELALWVVQQLAVRTRWWTRVG